MTEITTVDRIDHIWFFNAPFPAIQKKKRRRSKLRLRLWETDSRCHYCHTKLTFEESTLDHKEPKCRGGRERVLCCEPCNQRKKDMSYSGFIKLIRQQTTPAEVKDYRKGL